MKDRKEKTSSKVKVRNEELHSQPQQVRNDKPGWGDKKLEGPNRPAE